MLDFIKKSLPSLDLDQMGSIEDLITSKITTMYQGDIENSTADCEVIKDEETKSFLKIARTNILEKNERLVCLKVRNSPNLFTITAVVDFSNDEINVVDFDFSYSIDLDISKKIFGDEVNQLTDEGPFSESLTKKIFTINKMKCLEKYIKGKDSEKLLKEYIEEQLGEEIEDQSRGYIEKELRKYLKEQYKNCSEIREKISPYKTLSKFLADKIDPNLMTEEKFNKLEEDKKADKKAYEHEINLRKEAVGFLGNLSNALTAAGKSETLKSTFKAGDFTYVLHPYCEKAIIFENAGFSTFTCQIMNSKTNQNINTIASIIDGKVIIHEYAYKNNNGDISIYGKENIPEITYTAMDRLITKEIKLNYGTKDIYSNYSEDYRRMQEVLKNSTHDLNKNGEDEINEARNSLYNVAACRDDELYLGEYAPDKELKSLDLAIEDKDQTVREAEIKNESVYVGKTTCIVTEDNLGEDNLGEDNLGIKINLTNGDETISCHSYNIQENEDKSTTISIIRLATCTEFIHLNVDENGQIISIGLEEIKGEQTSTITCPVNEDGCIDITSKKILIDGKAIEEVDNIISRLGHKKPGIINTMMSVITGNTKNYDYDLATILENLEKENLATLDADLDAEDDYNIEP